MFYEICFIILFTIVVRNIFIRDSRKKKRYPPGSVILCGICKSNKVRITNPLCLYHSSVFKCPPCFDLSYSNDPKNGEFTICRTCKCWFLYQSNTCDKNKCFGCKNFEYSAYYCASQIANERVKNTNEHIEHIENVNQNAVIVLYNGNRSNCH
jgi:hypothetical protein